MKIGTWKLLLLHSLFLYEVNCKKVRSCSDTLISCGEDSVITITGGTASIIPHLLERCNARRECTVSIMHGECFSVYYWCRPDISTLEIKPSSRPIMHIKPNQSAIGFMSAGYTKGKHQRAQNINCNITLSQHGKQAQRNISFILYDFASYANSTDICLSVRGSTHHPICSGSHECHTSYGHFDITDKGQFSIMLGGNATVNVEAPEVRFWFEIIVTPQSVHFDSVECLSKPAASKTTNETGSSDKKDNNNAFIIIITTAGLGGCFLLTAVTLILVTVFWCKKSGQELKNEDAYTYIDLYSLDSRQDLTRDDDRASRASVAASMAASVAASVAWRAEPVKPPLAGIKKKSLPINSLESKDQREEESNKSDPEVLQKTESGKSDCLAQNEEHECEETRSQPNQKKQDNAEFNGDTEYLEPVNIEHDQQEENVEIASDDTENQDVSLESVKRKIWRNCSGSSGDLEDVKNVGAQIQALMKQGQHAYTSLETTEASGGGTGTADSPYTTLDSITHTYRMKDVKTRQDSLESPKGKDKKSDARESLEEKACPDYLELLPDDPGTPNQDTDAVAAVGNGAADACDKIQICK